MNWILLAVATLQPISAHTTRVGCELEIKQMIRMANPMPHHLTFEQEEAYKSTIDELYNGQKSYLCVRNKPQNGVDKSSLSRYNT
jgi:hypothetical protein